MFSSCTCKTTIALAVTSKLTSKHREWLVFYHINTGMKIEGHCSHHLFLRGHCTPNLKLACFVSFLKIINTYQKFIHSNLISCSLIGSLVNTRSVWKMSTALRILCPDCVTSFWCVITHMNVTLTDPFFFLLGKVVNILHI